MSEPPLLPLQGPLLQLVETERRRPRAPDAARTNVQARLHASLAAGGQANTHGASAMGAHLGRAASHALAFVAGGIAGAAVYAHVASRPAPIAPAPPLAPVELPAPPEPAPEVSSTDLIMRAPLAAPSFAHETVTTESGLKAERALLDKARAALGRGDNDECLAVVKKHADTFARGRLAEEREALAIKALVNLGRADEARQRGARFRARYPRSLLLPAVESALESIP